METLFAILNIEQHMVLLQLLWDKIASKVLVQENTQLRMRNKSMVTCCFRMAENPYLGFIVNKHVLFLNVYYTIFKTYGIDMLTIIYLTFCH